MSSAQKKQADTTACISALQVRREEIQLAVKARLWLCAGAIARKSATKALLPRPDAVAKLASLVLILDCNACDVQLAFHIWRLWHRRFPGHFGLYRQSRRTNGDEDCTQKTRMCYGTTPITRLPTANLGEQK
jgi:hypothetical protein